MRHLKMVIMEVPVADRLEAKATSYNLIKGAQTKKKVKTSKSTNTEIACYSSSIIEQNRNLSLCVPLETIYIIFSFLKGI
jgi:uncharacterized protein YhbP (UPF0306 family)